MPFANYGGFGESYFRGRADATAPDGAYAAYDPAAGAGTVDYDTFIDQLDTLTGSDPTVLVVGCGTGVTVRGLRTQSSSIDDAFGMDVSQWAIDNHAPGVAQDIIQGDALEAAAFDAAQSEWNVNQAFDVIYTEFVLSHYTDSEAQTIHQNCVDHVSFGQQQRGTVVHRMWSNDSTGFNTKTVAEWQSLMSSVPLDGVSVEWIDYDNPSDSTI